MPLNTSPWDDHPFYKSGLARFEQARELGSPGLLRLWAENILECGYPRLAPGEIEELERIAAAPQEADQAWLSRFDFLFWAAAVIAVRARERWAGKRSKQRALVRPQLTSFAKFAGQRAPAREGRRPSNPIGPPSKRRFNVEVSHA